VKPLIIIDFDSTFIVDETLDFMAKNLHRNVQIEIKKITDRAMNGELDFNSALIERTRKLKIHKSELSNIIESLKKRVSPSFISNKKYINSISENIFIISGGFKEIIIPIVRDYGIKQSHVYANEFIFDDDEMISGINEKLEMSQSDGKNRILETIDLSKGAYVVGDGITDLKMKKVSGIKSFICYVENINRPEISKKADFIASNFNEVIKIISHP
tara:strand:+ start:1102 stop:1749 length:648 start_codon:yes stop_codon:yes gene_type:complete